MRRADVTIAVLAKAPVAGLAKTRLISTLGAEGAAALQARMIERTVTTALSVAPVTLWITPDEYHPVFQKLAPQVTLAPQPDGDLGARMLAAIGAAQGPALVIGTDCPALTPEHLQAAANILRDDIDVVVLPAEDGGYVLIGMNVPQPDLFSNMVWSVPDVMAQTRRRMMRAGLSWREPARLWDVDEPADLDRLRGEFPALL